MTTSTEASRALALLAALALWGAPAVAHKKHHHSEPTAAQAQQPGQPPQAGPAEPNRSTAATAAMTDHMTEMEGEKVDRAKMSTVERALDWIGRLHPISIHFPLAFFPAALFTAVVGRRRPAFGKPVQFLVIAGGTIAPVAAVLGWLDAIGTDPDSLLTVHRWLGTAIGVAALGLAIWAWKRPEEDRRPGMVWALAALTAAIIVQGWYGGAMVHGADHMNW